MRLQRRLGGWRMVERYSGRGVVCSDDLGEQTADCRIRVWEQFLDGRGGRYKVEGELGLETPPETETLAEVRLEKGIRLHLRVLPDGRVLGDSAPRFEDSQRP